jgi:4-amino-4-deoxy-L-arabinose transferase-like glycosyltransferase
MGHPRAQVSPPCMQERPLSCNFLQTSQLWWSILSPVLKHIKALIFKDRLLSIILLAALILRLGYLWYYSTLPDWGQLTVDNYYHYHWAQSISNGDIFGDTTYFRAPLYVYCLAILNTLFGVSIWVSRLFGLAVGLASIILTYLLGRRTFNRNVGLTAAALQALCPIMIYFEGELLLDPLFTLLVQAMLYRLLVWREADTGKNIFFVGLALGLAAITRPTILAFVPVIVFMILVGGQAPRRMLTRTMIFIAGAACLIGPIFLRNLIVAGDPVLISSQGGINWYISNNPSADGVSAVMPEPLGFNWRIEDITHIAEKARGRPLKPGGVSAYWTSEADSWIFAHPGDFIRLTAQRLYYFLGPKEISNNRDLQGFFARVPLLNLDPLTFPVILALAVLGIFLTIRSNRNAQVLLSFLVVLVLVSSLFFVNSRFRMPIVPVCLLFAASGLHLIWNDFHRKISVGATRVVVAVLLFLIANHQWIHFPTGANPQPDISKGLYYQARGDFSRALEFNRKALAVDSAFPEANLNVGVCFLRMGQTDSAMYYFERERRSHPDRAKAYMNIASVLLLQNSLNEAQSEVGRGLALRPYDVTGNRLLIRIVARDSAASDDSLYQVCLQAAESTDNNLSVLNEAAGELLQRQKPDDADRFITLAVHANPPPIETDDGAFDANFPDSPVNFAQRKAFSYYLAGAAAGLKGLYGQTIRFSEMAIRNDSLLLDAYGNLARALRATGQHTAADSVERSARAIAERFHGAH